MPNCELLDIPNIKWRGELEINILSAWPEQSRKLAEVEIIFDHLAEIAKQEEARRALKEKNAESIIYLHTLLTTREIAFLVSVIKAYYKIKTIFN